MLDIQEVEAVLAQGNVTSENAAHMALDCLARMNWNLAECDDPIEYQGNKISMMVQHIDGAHGTVATLDMSPQRGGRWTCVLSNMCYVDV